MRMSQLFGATLREVPAEAELISHQLMLRAGLIRKLSSGLYSWLPLGLRSLRKVENIIREELLLVGAQELLMPMVQPATLWQDSGRWEKYGAELLRLQDRHQRDFCLAPTHEEVITDLFCREVSSYKQLPLNVFQIQTKFRDEVRPRFGVMRGREFTMKDAYSFHEDQASLDDTYHAMYAAYQKIFTRLGLQFRPVLADTGAIGGDHSHEFQVLADAGEDCIAYSDGSDYAANIELAESWVPTEQRAAPTQTRQSVTLSGMTSVVAIDAQHAIPPEKTVQVWLVKGVDVPVLGVVLRGDDVLNEVKLGRQPEVASPVTFVDPVSVLPSAVAVSQPMLGPVGLSMPLLVDNVAAVMSDFYCGANQAETLFSGVNWLRDVAITRTADLRRVRAGDLSPDGQGVLQLRRGIEVGQVFQLGDVYTKKLNASVQGQTGQAFFPKMGCYGIGVTRVVAAAIEQHHDARGIVWPESMAPYSVLILPLNSHKSQRVSHFANTLYQALLAAGVDVLLDDRKERPGVQFSDADLIGIPHRIVIGEKGLDQRTLEYKYRAAESAETWSIEEDIVASLQARLAAGHAGETVLS